MSLGEDDRQEILDTIGKLRTLLEYPETGVSSGGFYVLGPHTLSGINRQVDRLERLTKGEMIDYDES